MRKYLSFFRMRFINGLQYRAAAWSGIVTQFFWGGMEILLFQAFYRSGDGPLPMTTSELTSYIWLQQAFLAFFMAWFWENELFDAITTGNVIYELLRPISIYSMWFSRSMAARLAAGTLRCLPVILLAALLPAPYNLTPPAGLAAALLFLASMALAFLLVVALTMLIYLSTFFTLNARGVKLIAASVIEFLSGALIPLPFFPERLRTVIELLPFASMQSLPLYIYSGYLSGRAVFYRILLQIFWLWLLILLGRLMERQLLKHLVIQGG